MRTIIAIALLTAGQVYAAGCVGVIPITTFGQGIDVTMGGTYNGCGTSSGTTFFFADNTRLESVSILVDNLIARSWVNDNYLIKTVHFDVTGTLLTGVMTYGIDQFRRN